MQTRCDKEGRARPGADWHLWLSKVRMLKLLRAQWLSAHKDGLMTSSQLAPFARLLAMMGWPPGAPQRLIRMLKVKFLNHLRIQDVPCWDPRPLLPVYKVLESTSTSTRANQALNCVSWTPINKMRRRRRQRGWFHPAHVERGVDPHGPWKLEPHSNRTDDPLNRKRTHKGWPQLFGLQPKRKVLGGKLNLLPDPAN